MTYNITIFEVVPDYVVVSKSKQNGDLKKDRHRPSYGAPEVPDLKSRHQNQNLEF